MKLFSTKQIAEIDRYTIETEPVSDIDLMERASKQVSGWLVKHFSTEHRFIVMAGPGNNGGDSLAVARQMSDLGYDCKVYLLDFGKGLKGSPAINWQRLSDKGTVELFKVKEISDFPETTTSDVFLDGLFGSGLSRPLEGLPAELVKKINGRKNKVVSIDIPSGLMGEDNTGNVAEHIVLADYTLTFQFPKISFLFHENEKFTGQWEVLPIGLHPEGIEKVPSGFFMIEKEEVRNMLPRRSKFAHKGTFGHAFLIAGSYGKMGAAILASRSCLRAGTGLLTSHVPRLGCSVMQAAVPEAMVSIDQHDLMFTGFPDLSAFSAIGAGPGIGTNPNTVKALHQLIENAEVPLVFDADALNILSGEKQWLAKLPSHSVLTPHPGEFRRLAGESDNSWKRIQKQQKLAEEYNVVIVLKGAYTSVATPEGKVYFNPTGNPGMGTAGSGDVLTGIILGLMTQRISPENAAIAGVYLHGLAGDWASLRHSEYALVAGDIIDFLGKGFRKITG